MLSSTYPNPFFSRSKMRMVSLPFRGAAAHLPRASVLFFGHGHHFRGGAAGATPITMASACGGSGLSALASSRLTCQIWYR